LEAITQFPLFDRNGSRLTPTQDGSRFFQEVEKTFIGLAGLESAAASIRSFSASRLSVAAMPRLAGGLLARIVAAFKTEYPDVMVSIHSGNASAVHNWISSGFCDTGLAMLSGDSPGIQVEPVLTMNCVAVLPKGHRLTKLKKLKPADFAGEPFIAFPSATPLREKIDAVFKAAKVERQTVAEAGLGSSVCALVGAGLGVALINPLAAREEYEANGVEVRPFSPAVPVTVALLYPPYHTRTRLVSVFSRYAHQLMQEEMADLKARPGR
jgi:DNA-binding transcriptional LysR family regulator